MLHYAPKNAETGTQSNNSEGGCVDGIKRCRTGVWQGSWEDEGKGTELQTDTLFIEIPLKTQQHETFCNMDARPRDVGRHRPRIGIE